MRFLLLAVLVYLAYTAEAKKEASESKLATKPLKHDILADLLQPLKLNNLFAKGAVKKIVAPKNGVKKSSANGSTKRAQKRLQKKKLAAKKVRALRKKKATVVRRAKMSAQRRAALRRSRKNNANRKQKIHKAKIAHAKRAARHRSGKIIKKSQSS